MNTKVLLAALAGSIVSFLSGYVIWGIALKDFFDSNTVEGARACLRGDEMLLWAIFVGCVAWSLLLALLYSRWAGITTFKTGALGGLWVFFLVALGADFFTYAAINMMTMNAIIVDIIASAAQGALVGGVIGWALGFKDAK